MTIDWDEKRALLQEPNIAAVTQLCDELMAKRPGSTVPYIDPVHDEDECRIVTLQTSPGGPRPRVSYRTSTTTTPPDVRS